MDPRSLIENILAYIAQLDERHPSGGPAILSDDEAREMLVYSLRDLADWTDKGGFVESPGSEAQRTPGYQQ